MQKTYPCGLWPSSITTAMVTSAQKRFDNIVIDNGEIYWSEMRPTEGGRCVIVKRAKDGKIEDVLPPPYSARSRVHEYGGLSFAVGQGAVYFVNDKDQRIYIKDKPLTEAGTRFADLRVVGKHLIAVGEKGKITSLLLLILAQANTRS
ncbi:MAG: hypothetical protein LVR00_01925 [Rhabdochlamydiaceae bacterium]|jgi:hypothetical protein